MHGRVSGRAPLTLRFAPALAPGARVRSVSAGGRAVAFRSVSTGRAEVVSFEVPLGDGAEVTIHHGGGWRLEISATVPERGERSRGLKVLDARVENGGFTVALEGRAGARYELSVRRPGGRLSREIVEFPADGGDPRDGYVRRTLRFRL